MQNIFFEMKYDPDITILISNRSPASFYFFFHTFTHICINLNLFRGKLYPKTLQILNILIKFYDKHMDLNKKHMQTFEKANLLSYNQTSAVCKRARNRRDILRSIASRKDSFTSRKVNKAKLFGKNCLTCCISNPKKQSAPTVHHAVFRNIKPQHLESVNSWSRAASGGNTPARLPAASRRPPNTDPSCNSVTCAGAR